MESVPLMNHTEYAYINIYVIEFHLLSSIGTNNKTIEYCCGLTIVTRESVLYNYNIAPHTYSCMEFNMNSCTITYERSTTHVRPSMSAVECL